MLREKSPAARQAAPGRLRVAAPQQSRGDRSHVKKEESQQQQLHAARSSRPSQAEAGERLDATVELR